MADQTLTLAQAFEKKKQARRLLKYQIYTLVNYCDQNPAHILQDTLENRALLGLKEEDEYPQDIAAVRKATLDLIDIYIKSDATGFNSGQQNKKHIIQDFRKLQTVLATKHQPIIVNWENQLIGDHQHPRTMEQVTNRITGLTKLDTLQQIALYKNIIDERESLVEDMGDGVSPLQPTPEQVLETIAGPIQSDDLKADKLKSLSLAIESSKDNNKPLAALNITKKYTIDKNNNPVAFVNYQVTTIGKSAAPFTTREMHNRLNAAPYSEQLQDNDLQVDYLRDNNTGKYYLGFKRLSDHKPLTELDPTENAKKQAVIKEILERLISEEHIPLNERHAYVTPKQRSAADNAIQDAQEWLNDSTLLIDQVDLNNLTKDTVKEAIKSIDRGLRVGEGVILNVERNKGAYRPDPSQAIIDIETLSADLNEKDVSLKDVKHKLEVWQAQNDQDSALSALENELEQLQQDIAESQRDKFELTNIYAGRVVNADRTIPVPINIGHMNYLVNLIGRLTNLTAVHGLSEDNARVESIGKEIVSTYNLLLRYISVQISEQTQHIVDRIDEFNRIFAENDGKIDDISVNIQFQLDTLMEMNGALENLKLEIKNHWRENLPQQIETDGLALVQQQIDAIESYVGIFDERMGLNQFAARFQAVQTDFFRNDKNDMQSADALAVELDALKGDIEAFSIDSNDAENNQQRTQLLGEIGELSSHANTEILKTLDATKNNRDELMRERVLAANYFEKISAKRKHSYVSVDATITQVSLQKKVQDATQHITNDAKNEENIPLRDAISQFKIHYNVSDDELDKRLQKAIGDTLVESEVSDLTHYSHRDPNSAQAYALALGKIFGHKFFKPYIDTRERLGQLTAQPQPEPTLANLRTRLYGVNNTLPRTAVQMYSLIKTGKGMIKVSSDEGLYGCLAINQKFNSLDKNLQTDIQHEIDNTYGQVLSLMDDAASRMLTIDNDLVYNVMITDGEAQLKEIRSECMNLAQFVNEEKTAYLARHPELEVSRWNFKNGFKATNDQIIERIRQTNSPESNHLIELIDKVETVKNNLDTQAQALNKYKTQYRKTIQSAVDNAKARGNDFDNIGTVDELLSIFGADMSRDQLKDFVYFFQTQIGFKSGQKPAPITASLNIAHSRLLVDSFNQFLDLQTYTPDENTHSHQAIRAMKITLLANAALAEYHAGKDQKPTVEELAEQRHALKILFSRIPEDGLSTELEHLQNADPDSDDVSPVLSFVARVTANSQNADDSIQAFINVPPDELVILKSQLPFLEIFINSVKETPEITSTSEQKIVHANVPQFSGFELNFNLIGNELELKQTMLANFMALPNMTQHEKVIKRFLELNNSDALKYISPVLSKAVAAKNEKAKSGFTTFASTKAKREVAFKHAMADLYNELWSMQGPSALKEDVLAEIQRHAQLLHEFVADKIIAAAKLDNTEHGGSLYDALLAKKLIDHEARSTFNGATHRYKALDALLQAEAAHLLTEVQLRSIAHHIGTDNWTPVRHLLDHLFPDGSFSEVNSNKFNTEVQQHLNASNAYYKDLPSQNENIHQDLANEIRTCHYNLYPKKMLGDVPVLPLQLLRKNALRRGPAWKRDYNFLSTRQASFLDGLTRTVNYIPLMAKLNTESTGLIGVQQLNNAQLLQLMSKDAALLNEFLKDVWENFKNEPGNEALLNIDTPDQTVISSIRKSDNPVAMAIADLFAATQNFRELHTRLQLQYDLTQNHIAKQEGKLIALIEPGLVNQGVILQPVSIPDLVAAIKYEHTQAGFDRFVETVDKAKDFTALAALQTNYLDKPITQSYLRGLMISRLANRYRANLRSSSNISSRITIRQFAEYFNGFTDSTLVSICKHLSSSPFNPMQDLQMLKDMPDQGIPEVQALFKGISGKPNDLQVPDYEPGKIDLAPLKVDIEALNVIPTPTVKTAISQTRSGAIAPHADPVVAQAELLFKDLIWPKKGILQQREDFDPKLLRSIAVFAATDPSIIKDLEKAHAGYEKRNQSFADDLWYVEGYKANIEGLTSVAEKLVQAMLDGRVNAVRANELLYGNGGLDQRIEKISEDYDNLAGNVYNTPIIVERVDIAANAAVLIVEHLVSEKAFGEPGLFAGKPSRTALDTLEKGIQGLSQPGGDVRFTQLLRKLENPPAYSAMLGILLKQHPLLPAGRGLSEDPTRALKIAYRDNYSLLETLGELTLHKAQLFDAYLTAAAHVLAQRGVTQEQIENIRHTVGVALTDYRGVDLRDVAFRGKLGLALVEEKAAELGLETYSKPLEDLTDQKAITVENHLKTILWPKKGILQQRESFDARALRKLAVVVSGDEQLKQYALAAFEGHNKRNDGGSERDAFTMEGYVKNRDNLFELLEYVLSDDGVKALGQPVSAYISRRIVERLDSLAPRYPRADQYLAHQKDLLKQYREKISPHIIAEATARPKVPPVMRMRSPLADPPLVRGAPKYGPGSARKQPVKAKASAAWGGGIFNSFKRTDSSNVASSGATNAPMTIEQATKASVQILNFLQGHPTHYAAVGVFRLSSAKQNEDDAIKAIEKGEDITERLENEPNLSFTLLKRLLNAFPPLDTQEKLDAALATKVTLEEFMNGIEDEFQKQLFNNVLTAAAIAANSSAENRMDADNLGVVIAPNLISGELLKTRELILQYQGPTSPLVPIASGFVKELAKKLSKSTAQSSPAPSNPNTSPASDGNDDGAVVSSPQELQGQRTTEEPGPLQVNDDLVKMREALSHLEENLKERIKDGVFGVSVYLYSDRNGGFHSAESAEAAKQFHALSREMNKGNASTENLNLDHVGTLDDSNSDFQFIREQVESFQGQVKSLSQEARNEYMQSLGGIVSRLNHASQHYDMFNFSHIRGRDETDVSSASSDRHYVSPINHSYVNDDITETLNNINALKSTVNAQLEANSLSQINRNPPPSPKP